MSDTVQNSENSGSPQVPYPPDHDRRHAVGDVVHYDFILRPPTIKELVAALDAADGDETKVDAYYSSIILIRINRRVYSVGAYYSVDADGDWEEDRGWLEYLNDIAEYDGPRPRKWMKGEIKIDEWHMEYLGYDFAELIRIIAGSIGLPEPR